MTFKQWFSYNHTCWYRVDAYEKQKTLTKEYQVSISGLKIGRGRLRNLRSGRLRESFKNGIWLTNKTVFFKVVAYEKWWLWGSWLYLRCRPLIAQNWQEKVSKLDVIYFDLEVSNDCPMIAESWRWFWLLSLQMKSYGVTIQMESFVFQNFTKWKIWKLIAIYRLWL